MSVPISLPPLGFGAAQLGNLYRPTSDEEARGAVDSAWEQGIRYFDTAPHYGLGRSEERLGALLQHHPREEYLVSTKVGRLLRPGPGDGDDMDEGSFAVPNDRRRVWDFSARGIRTSHEESLERLGLDRVDILYLHDVEEGPTEQALTEGLAELVRMRDEGLVRWIGAGSKDTRVLTRIVQTGLVDLVMCSGRYTLLEQPAADALLPACLEHGVGVVAVSVFNSGILAHPEPPSDATYEYEAAPPAMLEKARVIAGIATSHGIQLPDLAIQYPLRHPAIESVVLGMRTRAQVGQNAGRMHREIPQEAWDALAEL